MQNKGFVKVFAVLLTLVCMFYLSFSFVTRHYNSKAAEYAGGDPVKESSYLDSLSTQKVWLGYTLKECREMEISLGLDLRYERRSGIECGRCDSLAFEQQSGRELQ